MAEIGNHPAIPDADYSQSLAENVFQGIGLQFTGNDENSVAVGFHCSSVAGGGADVYASIWRVVGGGDDVLVAEQTSALAVSASGWKSITVDSAALSSANTYYALLVADSTTSNIVVMSGDYANGSSTYVGDYYSNMWSGSAWTSPAEPNPGGDVGFWNMYIETAAGGGGATGKSNPLMGPFGGPLAGGL